MLGNYIGILAAADTSSVDCAARLWGRLLDERWQEELRRLMTAHPRAGEQIIRQIPTPFGEIIFGGLADHTFLAGNILFIADLGFTIVTPAVPRLESLNCDRRQP